MCHSPIHPFHVKLNRNFNVLVITPLALVPSGALVTAELVLGVAGKANCNIECCMHQLAATTECVSTHKKKHIKFNMQAEHDQTELYFLVTIKMCDRRDYISLSLSLFLSIFLAISLSPSLPVCGSSTRKIQ